MSTISTDEEQATTHTPGLSTSYNIRQVPFKLDNVDLLVGHENYDDWAAQVGLVLRGMGVMDIVLDPTVAKSVADTAAMEQSALLVLIQVLSKPILKVVAKLHHPHSIWTYLRQTYYRDSAFSFVSQINTLFGLSGVLDSSRPLSEFIELFESEWQRLYALTASNDPKTYRASLRTFLDFDSAKRDLLLACLVPHYPNPVDNLTTKDNLTYSELKTRLYSLSTSHTTSQDTAFVAGRSPAARKPYNRASRPARFNRQPGSIPGSNIDKNCSYCSKRGHQAAGHT